MTVTNEQPEAAFAEGCAVIFGGTGGIGQSCAKLLAARVSDMVITYRSREQEADTLVQAIKAMGRKASAVQCETSDSASVHKVIDAAVAEHGKVHTVVSAGGPTFDTARLIETPNDAFRDVIETDVFGFFNIAKAGITAMRKSGGGSIVAVVTLALDRLLPQDGLSAVPKAAVWQMIKHLAIEETVNNIRANAVGPGIINGGMVLPMLRDPKSKVIIETLVKQTPMRRLGTCDEIAEAVAFLASSKASFITGQMVMVDGGLSV